MAGPYRIDIILLHQAYVPEHRLAGYDVPRKFIMLMTVHALYRHRHPIDQKLSITGSPKF